VPVATACLELSMPRCAAASALWRGVPTTAGPVRKGSPVRVRQRASQTALRRGCLVLGVDRVTTSLMDRGSPVQASVATSSGERGFAGRAAVVLDAVIRHGGPAGYSAGTVRSGGLPASRQRSCATRSPRDAIAEGCTPGSACDRRVAAGAPAPHERSGAPGQDAARSPPAVSCRPTSRSVVRRGGGHLGRVDAYAEVT
jgi:hypothetical protein